MNINQIPKSIRAIVPYSLKRFLVKMYVKWVMVGSPSSFDKPKISFADVLPPDGSFIRGGKVKLTYLRKRWGEYKRGFNILYLVSSALPPYPDIWVKEAKKRGVKVVWNQNGIGVRAWAPDTWQQINETMKPLQFADFVAYQSNFAKRESDDLVAKANGPWEIITNSCDVNVFHPSDNS